MAHSSYGTYPLHDAAELGSLADVEVLISIGKIPINLQNPAGKTPLMLAAQKGHRKVVEELLSSGAKVNYVSLDGNNAIKLAAEAQHKELVELLLNQKKLPKKKVIKEALNSGLSMAISQDPADLSMVRFFIEKGAAPSLRDIDLMHNNKADDNHADLLSEMVKKALLANKKKGMLIAGKGLLYLLGPGLVVGLILVIPPLLTFAVAVLGTAAVVMGVTSVTKALKNLFGIRKENKHYKKIIKELNAVSNNPEEIVSATHEEVKNPVSENPSEVADTIHNEVRVDMSDQKSDSSGIAPLLDAHDKVRKATERLKNIPKILNATNSSQIKGKLLSTRESELNPADLTKKTKAGVEELQNIIDDLDKRLKSKEPIITEGQNLSPAKVVGSNQNKPLPQDIFVKSIVDGVASDNKIKSLIKEGAEVNFRIGSSMDTPLIYTVRHGRQLLARDLVKNGANLNMQDSKGDTALHVAVANEDADMVRMLVEHGANRYIRNRNGNIPANLAMNKRNESNQKITDLLKSGLQNRQYNSEFPEVREGKFKEQFHISQGLLDEVVALIDHGSNVDSSIGYGFVTPLIYAVECRRADVVEKLIKNGANLNMQDANGDTALHHAAALGDLKMVKLLLKSGAEPEALNEKYRCPIDRAKLRNHQEVVKFLDGYQNNLKAKARQFDLSSKDVISEDDERKVIPGI